MSALTFVARKSPFPRWMGPYSPSRGFSYGFRVREGIVGAWVRRGFNEEFWQVESPAAAELATLVKREFGGGRILFLPNGMVVKPLQDDEKLGQRVLVGRIAGPIRLKTPGGDVFDLSAPGKIKPGDLWLGPTTTGLECTLASAGRLTCKWTHPHAQGRDEVEEPLRGADQKLYESFRTCRPGHTGGRVRVTANGHVITNRQNAGGDWESRYVGWIDPNSWPDWSHWIEEK